MAAGIVLATAVGWLLRLNGIDQRTLFWDEAYHVALALEPSVQSTVDAVLSNPPSDPLYAVFLRAWISLVGTSDPAIRLPSTIFGALTVPAAAWLGWEQTGSRRVTVAAAVIVALSPYLVEYGQEASLYALAALMTTLALAAGARWLRTGARADGVVAVLIAIVACYCHYVVPVLLGGVALLSLTRLGPPRAVTARSVVAAMAVVAVAWSPWALSMLASWLGDPGARTALANRASLSELGGALSQYASGTGALLEGVRPVQLLGVLAAAALMARCWFVCRDGPARQLRVFLVVFAVLWLVPWLVSQLTGTWLFVAHLSLFALPALAVAAAAGGLLPAATDSRWRTRFPVRVGVLALVGLLVAETAGLAVNFLEPPHGDDGTREIVQLITAQGSADEPVFMSPAATQLVFEHYLDNVVVGLPDDVDLRALYLDHEPDVWLAATIGRFQQLSAGHDEAWLVYGDYRDEQGRFLDWISTNHALTLELSAQIGDLYRIRLR